MICPDPIFPRCIKDVINILRKLSRHLRKTYWFGLSGFVMTACHYHVSWICAVEVLPHEKMVAWWT